jgi:hypothetical protein
MLKEGCQVGRLLQDWGVEVSQQPVAVTPGIAVNVQQQRVAVEVL